MQYPTPKHLRDILALDLKRSDDHELFGTVKCGCGSETFALLYVGNRNEEEKQHFLQVVQAGEHWFLRIGARCASCCREHLLFDDHFHGWNGYVCTEEPTRRLPRPAFQEWTCQRCGSAKHKISLGIQGEDKEDALAEGEDVLTEADWFEAFGWFTIDVTCASCGLGPTRIIDYETM